MATAFYCCKDGQLCHFTHNLAVTGRALCRSGCQQTQLLGGVLLSVLVPMVSQHLCHVPRSPHHASAFTFDRCVWSGCSDAVPVFVNDGRCSVCRLRKGVVLIVAACRMVR